MTPVIPLTMAAFERRSMLARSAALIVPAEAEDEAPEVVAVEPPVPLKPIVSPGCRCRPLPSPSPPARPPLPRLCFSHPCEER